ncbi:MAG: non-heme iron oxygenase ferredoxin subunit [Deltaproteobacteria bacterium]|nr:non-heme iron oxygenase ferredoxin subunit [Deltaproteobacteria bacterium]
MGRADAIAEGDIVRYECGGKVIAIARRHGECFAFDDTCTHAEFSLADGMLEGYEIECCAHGARFDIRTGGVTQLPATAPVKTYAVKEEGATLYVDLDC